MGNEIGYEDFEIEVTRCLCKRGTLEVRVLRSPYNRPREVFRRPFSPKRCAEIIEGVEALVRSSSRGLRDLEVEAKTAIAPKFSLDAQEVGRKLFEALFTGSLRDTFYNSRSVLDAPRQPGKKKGLRLRLSFGTAKSYQADLGALPWELLYHPGTGFLAQDPRTPIVRYLDAEQPTTALEIQPPLRMLVVMCQPHGTTALNLPKEQQRIREALGKTPNLEIEFLFKPATLERLCRRLRDGKVFQIVHFMGHGEFKGGKGALLFEDDAGRKHPVPGKLLATQLGEDLNALRLIVLNACEGAKMPREKGRDPFTGVAAALTMKGVPATVAMQFPISDVAATAFSEEFYRSLAQGRPVDAAVADGRLAIQRQASEVSELQESESLEWATPVLFLRNPDGNILDLQTSGPSKGASPIRVGILSFIGWGQEIRKENDYLLDLTRYYDDRTICSPELWQRRIAPEIKDFLEGAVKEGFPHRLEMPAHSSIAFTAGYHLGIKSGLDLAIRQRGERGAEDWRSQEGEVPVEPLWALKTRKLKGKKTKDFALAIAISRRVLVDIDTYLKQQNLPLRELLVATPAGGTAQDGILSGAHANRMAQTLANWIEDQKREGTLHLFVSGPNAFVFYLGQYARDFDAVQLYEHDFGGTGTYTPSIRLPLPSRVTSPPTELHMPRWAQIAALLILLGLGLWKLLPLEPGPVANPDVTPPPVRVAIGELTLTCHAKPTEDELPSPPLVPVILSLEGTARNLDGHTIEILSRPLSDEDLPWTVRNKVSINAGRWEAHGVPVRRRYQSRYTHYALRARTTDEPVFRSADWHVVIEPPTASITAINGRDITECSVTPYGTLNVRGQALHVLPDERIYVAVLGEMYGNETSLRRGWSVAGDGSWEINVDVDDGHQFRIWAGIRWSAPDRSMLNHMGSPALCRAEQQGEGGLHQQ